MSGSAPSVVGLVEPKDAIRVLAEAVPKPIRRLCDRLAEGGYRTWVVGGSVRDTLLTLLGGSAAKFTGDWDLATDATPDRVQAMFPRVIATGLSHGTVTVLSGSLAVEVTTLRADSEYSDGRHPDRVEFVTDILKDLARRDFTVNAMAFEPRTGELLDPFRGLIDLQAKVLRAVGDPAARFAEDGLRVLRATRFVATLEFHLEPATAAAIRPSLLSYQRVSPERIREEWCKALKARHARRAFELMQDHGLLELTAPELADLRGCSQNRHHAYDVWEHTLRVLDEVDTPDISLRLAALLHDLGKPGTRATHPITGEATFYQHELLGAKLAIALLHRLRFSNEVKDRVGHLVRNHLVVYSPTWSDAAVRRWIRRVTPERIDDILALVRADILGKRPDVDDELAQVEQLRQRVTEVLAQATALSLRDLELTGKTLMSELCLAPGPVVGRLLGTLLDEVLEDPSLNLRDRLVERSRQLLAEWGIPAGGTRTMRG